MSDERRLTPHAELNRKLWDEQSSDYQARHGDQLDKSGGTAWGVWQIPESELQVLGDVAGRDVLEFGCGAAQWSIALHKLGARVTGLDNSAAQLEHGRKLMADAGVDFPLVHASAEATGLPAESFDIVFCDFGAMTFADPQLTVPEAARLLRLGGLFAFSGISPIADIAWPPDSEHPEEKLTQNYWEDIHRIEAPNEPINFQLTFGEWIRVFRANGFAIESLIELRPTPDAVSSYRDEADRDWARRWPMEHIWRLRREPTAS
ncbi:MAG TPA: class I SAM-dependent methyltransferase [Solirubrobacteraceae bacterium]|jgi:SAM-dependent methyltransferase